MALAIVWFLDHFLKKKSVVMTSLLVSSVMVSSDDWKKATRVYDLLSE